MTKLTAAGISGDQAPGLYGDGGGLYLQVGPTGTKAWAFRYKLNGQSRTMGLGAFDTLTLREAREAAEDCRRLKARRIDPISERTAERQREQLAAAKLVTFEHCADAFMDANEIGWRNAKHRQQWRNTLKVYAYPILGKLPVHSIDEPLIIKVLQPIWNAKPETADRLRGRIESVLHWATAHKYRLGANPATWRGNLDQVFPPRSKVRAVKHHTALAFAEMGVFMAGLRQRPATAARALEFAILTATRTQEVLGARWGEIDERSSTWTIPAERMKAGKEHRVPLSAAAIAVLDKMRPLRRDGGLVFPSKSVQRTLSNMAMLVLLRRMNRGDVTVHGFRSTFRDWVAECTSVPREVAELALAHAIGNAVEAAYWRGDLFNKRRDLMEAWAKYCDVAQVVDNVVSMERGVAER